MASSLRELLEQEIVTPARIPEKNEFSPGDLDKLEGYTIPLTDHDYSAGTPLMWNSLYEKFGMNLRNIMVVGDPENTETILNALKQDPKYLGGGAGSGFKEVVKSYLDRIEPSNLQSVNIIVKEGDELVGYNTDTYGLIKSVEEGLERAGKKIEGSNLLVFGAGGVSKDFCRRIAEMNPKRIGIINRTVNKATEIAYGISEKNKEIEVYSAPEDLIRGTALNTLKQVDAVINTTNKGSDGKTENTSAFAPSGEFNNTYSIDVLRLLKAWNPDVAIIDITSHKNGTITLRHAKSAGLENLIDKKPMVIHQAVPAYKFVEQAHKDKHPVPVDEKEVMRTFREAMNQ